MCNRQLPNCPGPIMSSLFKNSRICPPAYGLPDRLLPGVGYRHETDNPTIGLILCQDKKRVLAEYALRGMNKPIGISEYELTRALPEELKSALPTIEEIEAELSADLHDENEGEV